MYNISYIKHYLLTKQRLIRLKFWKLGYRNLRIVVGKEKQFYIKSKLLLGDTKNIIYQILNFLATRYPNKIEDWEIKRIKTIDGRDLFDDIDKDGNLYLKFEVNLLPSELLTTSQNDVLISILLRQILRKFNITMLPNVYLNNDLYPCGGHIHYSFVSEGEQNFLHESNLGEKFCELFDYYYRQSLEQNLLLIAPSEDSFQRLFSNELVKIDLTSQKNPEHAIHKGKLGVCHRNIGTNDRRIEIRSISGGVPAKLNNLVDTNFSGGSNPYLANMFVLDVIDKTISTILSNEQIENPQEDFQIPSTLAKAACIFNNSTLNHCSTKLNNINDFI